MKHQALLLDKSKKKNIVSSAAILLGALRVNEKWINFTGFLDNHHKEVLVFIVYFVFFR